MGISNSSKSLETNDISISNYYRNVDIIKVNEPYVQPRFE